MTQLECIDACITDFISETRQNASAAACCEGHVDCIPTNSILDLNLGYRHEAVRRWCRSTVPNTEQGGSADVVVLVTRQGACLNPIWGLLTFATWNQEMKGVAFLVLGDRNLQVFSTIPNAQQVVHDTTTGSRTRPPPGRGLQHTKKLENECPVMMTTFPSAQNMSNSHLVGSVVQG